MKLYTGVGDKGMTKLIGGDYVSKDSDRVNAYGTFDELNTYIGLVISKIADFTDISADLLTIQSLLFDLGTDIANPNVVSKCDRFKSSSIKWLESRIDVYADESPKITRFILPGGSEVSSLLQICRTITRRAERNLVRLSWSSSFPNDIEIFVNRLSDFFYAIARVINYRLDIKENYYQNGNSVFQ